MTRSKVKSGFVAITFLVFFLLVAINPGRSTVARFSEEVAWTLFTTAALSFLAICGGALVEYTTGSLNPMSWAAAGPGTLDRIYDRALT